MVEVELTGTFINEDYPWLACSPDGLVLKEDGTYKSVEVKCPATGKDLTIGELYELKTVKK